MKYKKGTFVVVPIGNLDSLPAIAQALFIWICKYANDDGECFPSRNKLAKHLSCDVRTVDKHMISLTTGGFVTKTSRKKKGSKENLSNLYTIQIVRDLSELNDTTPSEENDTVTISNINYTNLTNTQHQVSPEQEKVFSFEEEMESLKVSKWKGDKIIYLYFLKKGFKFENLRQFTTARKRNTRPASLLMGYNSIQVEATMDSLIELEESKGFSWSLETIVKRIADIANK